jgi:hypothetical protein
MLDTCWSLSQAKCSLVRGSTKCRFRPRGHLSANAVNAARVYGSRTAARSSPSACACLAAPRTLSKGKLVRTLQRRANSGAEWMFVPRWSVFLEANFMGFGTRSATFIAYGATSAWRELQILIRCSWDQKLKDPRLIAGVFILRTHEKQIAGLAACPLMALADMPAQSQAMSVIGGVAKRIS